MPINPLLCVEDLGKSLSVYRSFGFSNQMILYHEENPYFAELRHSDETGEGVMMFMDKDWWSQLNPGVEYGQGVLFYIPVNNIENWWEKLCNSPHIISSLKEEYYGREFLMEDPDGYKLSFFQPFPEGERLTEGMKKWTGP